MPCEKPVWVPGFPEPFGRCGKCPSCQKIRRLEWGNRMALEQFGLDYRPQFVTCTYTPEYLPENYAECLVICQRWLKLLRKRLDANPERPLRYFLVTEKGTKRGRLHQHLIIWNRKLSNMPILDSWDLMYKTWGMGRLQSEHIMSYKGFYYVSKYISKNLWDGRGEMPRGSRWSVRNDEIVKPGKLFTWSNKPALGNAGICRWKFRLQNSWHSSEMPPNWINMLLFGKVQKVYIPRDSYLRTIKEMGYKFDMEQLQFVRNKKWLEEQKEPMM